MVFSSIQRKMWIPAIYAEKMCGLISESEENTMQGPEDYKAISRKRGR